METPPIDTSESLTFEPWPPEPEAPGTDAAERLPWPGTDAAGGLLEKSWPAGLEGQEAALRLIASEWARAVELAPPMKSLHDGVSRMRLEFDVLWEAIRRDEDIVTIRTAAAQVGATALRFLVELCDVH